MFTKMLNMLNAKILYKLSCQNTQKSIQMISVDLVQRQLLGIITPFTVPLAGWKIKGA